MNGCSDSEARIRYLEYRAGRLRTDARRRDLRLGGLEQGATQLLSAIAAGGSSAPPPPLATVNATVRGCGGLVLAGALVELLKAGVVIDSATTNSSGLATVHPTSTGSHTVRASKTPRFVTASSTAFTVASGGTYTPSVTLSAATGYWCLNPNFDGTSVLCADPFPTTLHWTDSVGTHSFTTTTGGLWTGSYNTTLTGYSDTPSGPPDAFGCYGPFSISALVKWQITPSGTTAGLWTIQQAYYTCGGAAAPFAGRVRDGGADLRAKVRTATATSCTAPLALSFTMPADCVVSSSATVTVSE